MKINTIIWDIGGVLERTEDHAPRRALAASLNTTVDQLSHLIFGNSTEFRVQLGLISREEHFDYVQSELGLATKAELSAVIDQFFAGDRLDFKLVDHIRDLKRNYTTAVLSNYSDILRDRINNEWEIGDAFDHLIISAEVGFKKPSPEIYQVTIDTIGCQPGEAVFIDDDPNNIQAARQQGLQGIQFQSPEQALNQLNIILNNQEN